MVQHMISKENSAEILEDQVRDSYGKVVYSHKTHEKMADICLLKLKIIKWVQIASSAIITTTLLYSIFGDGKTTVIVAAILSTILLATTLYTKDYDLGEIAQKHTEAGNKLWFIRECFLSLLVEIKCSSFDAEQVKQQRDKLNNELNRIYSGSPRTNGKAYKKAQRALKKLGELTFSEQELDELLPEKLRRLA